jgi:2-iminobutanoate/2-iminopropanoate deaminase
MRQLSSTVLLTALAVLSLTPDMVAAQARRYVDPKIATDTTTFPYSEAVAVGNTLYLSGTIGLLPGNKVPSSAAEEARLVMDNVKDILTDAGMTMDDLVFVQVFCSDLSAYTEFNRVYRTYFTKEYPARAFLGVANVLYGARFEVQSIAVKR